MTSPPGLLVFKGDWHVYEKTLYGIFVEELANGGLTYNGLRVGCRRIPETSDRWFAFWHLVQEGSAENERYPDPRRCERLRWVRWVIENAALYDRIDIWQNRRGSRVNALLWYGEEYLVVLERRRDYWLLKTACCTWQKGRVRKLQRERDGSRNAL